MDAVRAEQADAHDRSGRPDGGTAHGDPGPRPRHPHRGAVLRGPPRRAGRRGHQDRAARHRRLHARDRPVRPGRAATADGYSLFWAVEGRGRKSITLDLRKPEGQDLFRRLAATADVVVENFRPGTLERWHLAPGDLDDSLVTVRISTFGQDGPYSTRPGLDRVGIGYGGLLHLTGYPDRPPVRVGVTISDYLTGVFAAQAATAALYARDVHRSGQGAVIDAALYGAVLRVLEWTIAAYDRLGVVRSREGNRLANSAPLDNYPTADGKYVCIVAGSDANFARLCRGDGRSPSSPTTRASRASSTGPRATTRSTASSRTGPGRTPRREIEEACVAHDVPVATAYTAADMFADPHFAARGDLVVRRRPGRRADAPAGAVPAVRRRADRRCPPARRGWASTPTRCSPRCSGSRPPSSRRSRDRGIT